METSDSEYFESADEDVESDGEDKKKPRTVQEKLKVLNLSDKEDNSNLIPVDTNKNKQKTISQDSDNNICTDPPESKQQETTPTLRTTEDNKITPSSDTAKEDNLWLDDELDWGKESSADDGWESVEEPLARQPDNARTWGSWGNWGVSTILSTATQLTHGISTAIGVPEPEEMARINSAGQVENLSEDKHQSTSFGLNNFVSGVSHFSTKVISGGLDTLETIGKKTMEVLQEGDPGLKKKRAFLKIEQDKPVLSQLLREAKEKAEVENKILEQKHLTKNKKNYETLFDDYQGLVHLEALEMLSRQCDIKLQTVLESGDNNSINEIQETLEQVKELCELPDEDDEEQLTSTEIRDRLESATKEINIPITYKNLLDTWEETENWLNLLKLDVCSENELHQQAIQSLAQLTAIAVEQFHKSGELLLVKEHRSTADEADSLVQLTSTLTSLIGVVAAKFSDKLNVKSSSCGDKNKDEVNGLITNVFFEAANSSSYIQDAFQLLIPVLQVGAL